MKKRRNKNKNKIKAKRKTSGQNSLEQQAHRVSVVK